MDNARRHLTRLIERGELHPEDYRRAAELLGLYPPPARWRHFLDRLLLWLGALAIACALLFFIAYNWTAMGRLGRFALVEMALLAALGCHFLTRGPIAQASLFVSALIVGGLLALFGQTYQTGADPWQLFFTWSLMILPWALLARLPALWMLVIGLWNLAAILYHQTFGGLLLTDYWGLYWGLFSLNAVSLLTWELAGRRFSWLHTSWHARLLATAMGVAITGVAILAIGEADSLLASVSLLAYVVFLGGLYWVYRHLKPDLFMIAGGCLSLLVVIDFAVLRELSISSGADGFLLLFLITIGYTTAAVHWLLKLNRGLQNESDQ